jgi:hypothetical protein
MRLVLVLITVCACADAATIAGNLGPGNTFQTGTSNSWATGDGGNSGNAVAFMVPAMSNYRLDQILVADNWFGGSSSLDVGLYMGSDPNTAILIESFSIPTSATSQFASTLFTLPSLLQPVLLAGNTYFIEETIPDCGTSSSCATTWGWQWNDLTPPQTGFYSEFGGASWFLETDVTPAYAVNATAVPEPASLLLLTVAVGLLLFWSVARSRRTGHKMFKAIAAPYRRASGLFGTCRPRQPFCPFDTL